MQIIKKRFLLLAAAILLLASCFLLLMRDSSKQQEADEGPEQAADGTEDSDDQTVSEYYLEKYGTPEDGFFEFSIENGVEDMVDFEELNSLHVYWAKPYYEEDELVQALISRFYGDSRTFEITSWDYEESTDGEMKGWGNFYRYTGSDGLLLSGCMNMSDYYAGNSDRPQLGSAEPLDYAEELIEEFHLGVWDGAESLMSVEAAGTACTAYTILDGYKVGVGLFGNETDMDQDGARYPSGFDIEFTFRNLEGEYYLSSIESMFAADITEAEDLKYGYADMDEILDVIYSNIHDAAQVFHMDNAYIRYNRGVTEEGTYVYTPWLVFEGMAAFYYDQTWTECDYLLMVNLNTQEIYDTPDAFLT